MNNKDIIELHRKLFSLTLQKKTGWGRNEILQVYDDAVKEVLYQIIEKGYESCNTRKEI